MTEEKKKIGRPKKKGPKKKREPPRDISHLRISGRLCKDPRIRLSTAGRSICNFAIIYNSPATNKVIFFNFKCFGRLAEYIYLNYKKGDYINVHDAGHLRMIEVPDKRNPNVKYPIALWLAWAIMTAAEKVTYRDFNVEELIDDY